MIQGMVIIQILAEPLIHKTRTKLISVSLRFLLRDMFVDTESFVKDFQMQT